MLYILFVIKHNIKVSRFNKELINKSAFEIMLYKDGASWGLLTISILLIIVGLILIYFYWRSRIYIDDSTDLVITLALAALIIISFIWTIIEINNPILQSACFVIVAIGIGTIAIES